MCGYTVVAQTFRLISVNGYLLLCRPRSSLDLLAWESELEKRERDLMKREHKLILRKVKLTRREKAIREREELLSGINRQEKGMFL